MTKIVNAWNEWDPLKRVILGRPEGTHIAGPEPGIYSHQPEGGYPWAPTDRIPRKWWMKRGSRWIILRRS
jgi:hypothetical protein